MEVNQAKEKSDVVAAPNLEAREQQTPIHLWLVDDNNNLRDTLAELLGQCHEIKCTRGFSSANAALSALASKTGPDVILLDIQMGQENGLDAIRPIKSLSRSTRVIMLTTFYDSHSHSRAMDDGASGFLLKRYPVEEMLDSIRRARNEPVSNFTKPRSHLKATCTSKESTETINARKEVRPAQATEATPSRRRPMLIEQCLGLFRNFRN